MGICLEASRVRIGHFFHPTQKKKWKMSAMHLNGGHRHVLRGLLLLMMCICVTGNDKLRNVQQPELKRLEVSTLYTGGHFDMMCDVTKMDSSILWSTALHARVTMACARDIETKPGPPKLIGGAKTRQSTLSFQKNLMAEKNEGNGIDLNNVMKELKLIKTEFRKRFDQVDSKIGEQVEKLKQQLEEVKTDQTESRKEINEIRKENRFL